MDEGKDLNRTRSRNAFRFAAIALFAVYWAPRYAEAFCVGSDESQPDYDPKYYSVSHEFRRAKYVVRARVTKEIWIGEDGQPKPLQPPFQNGNPRPWGFDPYLGAYYVVHVTQVFKGTPNADLRLFSENSTARFWLELGNEYVFFMDDDSFDLPIGEQLSIDTCGNSAHVTKARTTLRSLGRLSRPK